MRKSVFICSLFFVLITNVHAQAKIELLGKYVQNGSVQNDWLFGNYSNVFIKDSILYTTLLDANYISRIDLNKNSILRNYFFQPTIKEKYVNFNPNSFVRSNSGFLSNYSTSILYFNSKGKFLYFKAEFGEIIEQLFMNDEEDIIVCSSFNSGCKVYLLNNKGSIIDKIILNTDYYPDFCFFKNELISEDVNVWIKDKKIISGKNKKTEILDKNSEKLIGSYDNNIFLYSKKTPSKIILRSVDSKNYIGEIQLPSEMVVLIKQSSAYKETGEYIPILKVLSINEKIHYIVFASRGYLYLYKMEL